MDDERRRILEMVEQGKITSTEADELIEALGDRVSTRSTPSEPASDIEQEPHTVGLPVSFITAASRWLAMALASVVFAVRWLLGWWQGERLRRRRHL